MFRGRGDSNTIKRLADDDGSDEENVTSKWEEPLTTKVTPTGQDNSTTEKQTSIIKTGSKRPLPNQASYLNVLLESFGNI